MALVKCKECGAEISDKAAACPQCGAKFKRFKWWLWGPLAIFLAFLAFGASIPQYKADAMAARKVCETAFMSGGVASLSECDRQYDRALARGQQNR